VMHGNTNTKFEVIYNFYEISAVSFVTHFFN